MKYVLFALAAAFLFIPLESFSEGSGPWPLPGFMPTTGSPRILAVLVQTEDMPAGLSSEKIRQRLFSRDDDGFTSMAEYYDSVSYGKLTLKGDVTDWLNLSLPMREYSLGRYGRGLAPPGKGIAGMVEEAVGLARQSGVDFSRYDNDGDGLVDGLMIVHSGPDGFGSGNPDHIWSRVGYLSNFGMDPVEMGEVLVDRFVACPEYFSEKSPNEIRIYAHETGHLLGFPDLADHDLSTYGAGAFSLMAFPVPKEKERPAVSPDVWLKSVAGWTNPRVIGTGQSVVLRPLSMFSDAAVVSSGLPGEYFVLSYRQAAGPDEKLFGGGVLMWHVNERAIYLNRPDCEGTCEAGPLLSLEQADNKNDLERKKNFGDPGDFLAPGMATGNGTRYGATHGGAATITHSGIATGVRVSVESMDRSSAVVMAEKDRSPPCDGSPCVVLVDTEWVETGGDGDGYPEPGERTRLTVRLANYGQKLDRAVVKAGMPSPWWKRHREKLGSWETLEERVLSFEFKAPPPMKNGKPVATANSFWYRPRVTISTGRRGSEQVLSLRLLAGPPDILIVNDSPHSLGPYIEGGLKDSGMTWKTVDVIIDGLPSRQEVSSSRYIIWLFGIRKIDENFPDAKRLSLIEAAKGMGRTLMISMSRAGEIDGRFLGILQTDAVKNAHGVRQLMPPADDKSRAVLTVLGPYSPMATPHLELVPGIGMAPFLADMRGHVSALAGTGTEGGRLIVLGFPLEAMRQHNIHRLLRMADDYGLPDK